MTYYYVDISSDLVNELREDNTRRPEGWRLVARWGPRDKNTERWLVEDEGAPAELEDCLVDLAFTHDYESGRSEVSSRTALRLS